MCGCSFASPKYRGLSQQHNASNTAETCLNMTPGWTGEAGTNQRRASGQEDGRAYAQLHDELRRLE
eukprot:3293140-Alexandrium_andersonii.AAC.1